MVVEDCAGVGGRGVLSEAGGKKCSLKTKLQWWRIGMWKVVGGLAWAEGGLFSWWSPMVRVFSRVDIVLGDPACAGTLDSGLCSKGGDQRQSDRRIIFSTGMETNDLSFDTGETHDYAKPA